MHCFPKHYRPPDPSEHLFEGPSFLGAVVQQQLFKILNNVNQFKFRMSKKPRIKLLIEAQNFESNHNPY